MSIRTLHYAIPSLDSTLIAELDDDLTLFRGIPYASVEKRWTHSQVRHTLDSPFDATKFGPRCPQIASPNVAPGQLYDAEAGEDEFKCLNLNICVPTETLRGRSSVVAPLLPVMVWVHG